MPTYDTSISRDVSDDPLVPVPVAAQVVQEAVASSFVLSNARRVQMSSKTSRQPVLSVLPQAYWVSGDAGLKQTTTQDWGNVDLVAEELAAIVVVPDAYVSDSQVPIWDEVRPRLAESIGNAIDAAVLFGTNAPATFGTSAYLHAIAAGNAVVAGAGKDLAVDVASVAKLIAQDGFSVSGFASAPGFGWQLVGIRTTDGVAVYQPNLQGGGPGNLYGFPLREVVNGSWDATEAVLIAGDWSKAVVGVRQDITFKLFDQGVIADAEGNVVWSAMQNDGVALRVVFRVGYALANPETRLNGTDATRSPFGVLQATTAAS